MAFNYVESNCPTCGAKNRESCNTWAYGSPIRVCGSCRSEYLDRKWREVAVEGFDPKSTDPSFYMKGTGLLFLLGVLAFAYRQFLVFRHGGAPLMATVIVGACLLGAIGCGYLFVRVKFGFEDKVNEQSLMESKARLQNPAYVKKLIGYGYHVPEQYMPKEETKEETKEEM